MVVQMDVQRLVLLFHALLFGGRVGQVDWSGDCADVLHVLLGVAVQSAVDT